MSSDALFFEADRHYEALALLASSHLSKGDPWSAFPFADRRCRIIKPGAQGLLLRAEASRLAGHLEFAAADLAAALAIDPTDELLNLCALKWGSPEDRPRAAQRLISGGNAGPGVLLQALAALLSDGTRVVHSLRRRGPDVVGWMAWVGVGPLELRAHGPAEADVHTLERDVGHPLSSAGVSASSFQLENYGAALRYLEVALEGEVVARAFAPRSPTAEPMRARAAAAATDSPFPINVIVPVYDDLESTRACLETLIAQESSIGFRIIVVDDQTPNRELRMFLERAATDNGLLLIQNDVNLGFAGAVNKALDQCPEGDILLLNADTLLPAKAIDRLAAAAYGASDIGTVTPLSNNGELTSWPEPNVANPILLLSRIAEIDRCAAEANGAGVVDLPNGVGFCLYIKRSCLDAVGRLSEAYLRGYYEDVEFCLKAREFGFRNVCATGVFVGHAGSRSFGADKRALVVRNLAILHTRFPEYRIRYAAFIEGDPLKPARAAIDRLVVPTGGVVLLASGRGASELLALSRAKDIALHETDATALHCVVGPAADRVAFYNRGPGAPRSLSFSLIDARDMIDLRRYLSRLTIVRVEIFDAAALPESFLRELLALGARVELISADLQWFRGPLSPFAGRCRTRDFGRVCDECGADYPAAVSIFDGGSARRDSLNLALSRADAIKPMDRMAAAFAERIFKGKAVPFEPDAPLAKRALAPRTRAISTLGVLAPLPTPAIDRLILQLGRLFAQSAIGVEIVVLGRCIDDLALMSAGNVFVAGPVEPEEYERLVAQYGIGALALAHRTAFFGALDRLALATGAPKAYFDWSFGALPVETDDLSLDPRICDEKAASSLALWVGALIRRGLQ